MDKNTFSVSYTLEESNKLIELLDFANKAQGLAVASACVHFTAKLQQAYKESQQPVPQAPPAPANETGLPPNMIPLKPEPAPTDNK